LFEGQDTFFKASPAGASIMVKSSWRDALFVWDGILFPSTEEEKDGVTPVKWEGTWVEIEKVPDARDAEAPKRVGAAKDVESDYEFQVQGTAKSIQKDDKTFYNVSMIEGTGWDMGEGDEKKKYNDTAHEMYLKYLRWKGGMQTDNLVFAVGNNEFGSFISAGWMRPGNRITLARRYLGEKDARAKWGLEDLRKAVLEEILSGEEGPDATIRIPPWQCDALHVHDQTGKKRKGAGKKKH
jgi:hypothetical protein